MKQFKLDLNLDDDVEREAFITKYCNRGDRYTAHHLGLRGAGSVLLAQALISYAWARDMAAQRRLDGKIADALEREAICDAVYASRIAPVCECW